jgi:predicted TIM-barrel enzyme
MIEREDDLLARFRSVRRDVDGAFVLTHGGPVAAPDPTAMCASGISRLTDAAGPVS